jgi:hypothetical protein
MVREDGNLSGAEIGEWPALRVEGRGHSLVLKWVLK